MAEIRIHKGYMHTKYGDDHAYLIDDPVLPTYTEAGVMLQLMKELEFTPNCYNENDNFHDGLYSDGEHAEFEYIGYQDVAIPESVVSRIINHK